MSEKTTDDKATGSLQPKGDKERAMTYKAILRPLLEQVGATLIEAKKKDDIDLTFNVSISGDDATITVSAIKRLL